MSVALSISLAFAALGFWSWLASSSVVAIARLFSNDAFPSFRFSKSFMLFFIPMIAVIISAVMSQ